MVYNYPNDTYVGSSPRELIQKTEPAAKKLNKSVGDVWFLDDNLSADTTAKAAGMKVCGVYDDSSKDYAEQIKAVSDNYIYDFSELLSF